LRTVCATVLLDRSGPHSEIGAVYAETNQSSDEMQQTLCEHTGALMITILDLLNMLRNVISFWKKPHGEWQALVIQFNVDGQQYIVTIDEVKS
jgi:hypothetical protein